MESKHEEKYIRVALIICDDNNYNTLDIVIGVVYVVKHMYSYIYLKLIKL